jgi:hypothetical protein
MIVHLRASAVRAVQVPKANGEKAAALQGNARRGIARPAIAGQAGVVRTVAGKAHAESGANEVTTGVAAIAAASKARPKSISKN